MNTRGLYGQFVCARDQVTAPADWNRAALCDWRLAHHPLLSVHKLIDAANRHVGWLLGDTLGAENDPAKLPFEILGEDQRAALEKHLYQFGGRWACIVIVPGFERVYLDPSGSLAAVYRADRRALGSTPTILHWDTIDEYRNRKRAAPPLPANHFFPGGLTSDEDTRRLLPNHCLDLSTWTVARHWPVEEIRRESDSKAFETTKVIADSMRRTVESAAAKCGQYSGLSAGRDSRVLLACARNVLDRVDFVTFKYKDPAKAGDLEISRQIARRFSLRHEELDLLDPSAEQKREYGDRIGYCGNTGKTCDFDDACARLMKMDRGWITGYGGEVGRGYYWKPDDAGKTFSADELISRMHLTPADATRQVVQQWIASLPSWVDAYALLDLMYLEFRVGCWASPHQYGTAPFAMTFTPFTHRQVYANMLTLPIEYRRRQFLPRDILQALWPQTLAIAFKQPENISFARQVKNKLSRLKKRLLGTRGRAA